MQSRTCAVLTIASWWAAASPSLANEDIWKTSASGVWGVGSNWLDGSTPGNGDSATFNDFGPFTITFNVDPLAIQGLSIDFGNWTFTSNSFLLPSTLRVTTGDAPNVRIGSGLFWPGALTLGSAGGIHQPDKPLNLVVAGGVYGGALNVRFGSRVNSTSIETRSLLVIEGSSVETVRGWIGEGAIGLVGEVLPGRAEISGNGSQWLNSGALSIGRHIYDEFGSDPEDGEGALLISGGGFVEAYTARIGDGSDASGTGMTATVGAVTVVGDNSLWKINNKLDIGIRAHGIVNIQSGGTVLVAGETAIHSGGRVQLQGGEFQTGTLTVNGGTLDFEIGGLAQTTVTGQALLDGQLDLKLLSGFTPSPSETFIIMTAGSFSGAFANAANGQRVTPSDGGGSFLVHYGASSAFDPTMMILSDFLADDIPGDFDDDGDVDHDDLLQWQGDFGQNGLSDADQDGDSDGADFLVWQRNIGLASPVATVPELAARALALLGLVGLITRTRAQRG